MVRLHDNDNQPAGKVYTLDEAAEHLRLTNRGVAKIARQHGLCMVRGRDILFTDADIESIKEVLRCPSNSTSVVTHIGSQGLSKELDMTGRKKASVSEKARKLLIERSLKQREQRQKAAS
jgi:hypothetical protein